MRMTWTAMLEAAPPQPAPAQPAEPCRYGCACDKHYSAPAQPAGEWVESTDEHGRRRAVFAPAQPAEQTGPITDATYLGLAEDIARLTAESAALKLFALDVLKAWPLGDVDGGDLQEMAVKHGLLVPEKRTAVCSEEGCNCAEYYSAEEWAEGVTCYRRAEWLLP